MSFFRNHILFRKKGFRNRQSYLFDGVNESININSVGTALATTTTGTWSFWIKLTDATPVTLGFMISFSNGNSTDLIECYVNANGTLTFEQINNGVNQWALGTTNAAFSDNVWANCILVQNGVEPVIYINNTTPAQSFSVSTDKTTWFNNLVLNNGRIGGRFWAAGSDNDRSLVGNLDEVGFFNTNLTAVQRTEIYNNGKPKDLRKHSANDNLVSYFRFDSDPFDGTNFSVRDKKGNNHGATVNMEYADLELDVP